MANTLMTDADAINLAINLAIGRIFRMAFRPVQPGDVEEYNRCRDIILNLLGDPGPERLAIPLPGWNFGAGSTGVIE